MNKMRYLIRKAGALLMMLCIVLTMAGCQTTTLDGGTGKNRSVVSEEMETAQAEENSVTKQLSEVSAVISSVAGDEDMMDVDSVGDSAEEDLSKYDEKKTTETVNGAQEGTGTDLVTYSNGKGSQDQYQTEPVPEGEPNPVEP